MTLREFRAVWEGTLMGNCGYTKLTAEAAIERKDADYCIKPTSYRFVQRAAGHHADQGYCPLPLVLRTSLMSQSPWYP